MGIVTCGRFCIDTRCGRYKGLAVNLKRVRRLYREEPLMVRRRKRKKVALAGRQPLLPPCRQNEV